MVWLKDCVSGLGNKATDLSALDLCALLARLFILSANACRSELCGLIAGHTGEFAENREGCLRPFIWSLRNSSFVGVRERIGYDDGETGYLLKDHHDGHLTII